MKKFRLRTECVAWTTKLLRKARKDGNLLRSKRPPNKTTTNYLNLLIAKSVNMRTTKRKRLRKSTKEFLHRRGTKMAS